MSPQTESRLQKLRLAGRVAEAISFGRLALFAWGKILEADPADPEALLALADPYDGALQLNDVEKMLRTALNSPAPVHQADASLGLGIVSRKRGDLDSANTYFTHCLDINESLNRLSSIADALFGLSSIAFARGDYARAEPLYARAYRIANKGTEKELTIGAYQSLSYLYRAHRFDRAFDRAEELLRESLREAEATGDPLLISNACYCLGHLRLQQGPVDEDEVEALFKRAISLEAENDHVRHPWDYAALPEFILTRWETEGNQPWRINLEELRTKANARMARKAELMCEAHNEALRGVACLIRGTAGEVREKLDAARRLYQEIWEIYPDTESAKASDRLDQIVAQIKS